MHLRDQLTPLGYRHRGELVESGWRPDRLRSAVAGEGLLLLRRTWIVAPEAPAAIHAAAIAGAQISCVSAAQLLGMWRPGHSDALHLRLAPHASSSPASAVVHRCRVPVPAHSRALIDPVVNVLAVVAQCLPFEDARTVWDSALRARLLTGAELRAVAWSGPIPRELAQTATPQSHSGIETLGVTRLLRAGFRVRQQVNIAGHDVDALVGEYLVLQFDGFAHHRAAERRRDLAHDRRLQLRSYTVLRFDYDDVVNNWPEVERQVRAAVAQGLDRRRSG